MSSGKVVQVIGAVIDVEFPRDSVPQVYDALMVGDKGLTLEVQQQLGDGVVRAIVMGPSEGVSRGLSVEGTGAPISVPVGTETLGRIMDVLGNPIDEKGPIGEQERSAIHRAAPRLMKSLPRLMSCSKPASGKSTSFVRLLKTRKSRSVRGRRCRQDRDHDGVDQQRRQGPRWLFGICRCR